MPTVNIDGDAGGAIAACAAAQGAIDALHGKTVTVDINVRQNGGGMGEATRGMQDFGNAADRAGRSTRGMGDDLGRSAGHARGMADHMQRAGSALERASQHAQGMGNELERGSGHMAAIAGHAEIIRGALGSSSGGMRAIGSDAGNAGREMRQLESGASRAGLAVRGVMPSGGVGGGAIKGSIIDMQKLEDGTWGVAKAMKAIGGSGGGSGSGGSSGGFSWAGVKPEDMGSTMGAGGGRRPGGSSGGGFSWAGAKPEDIGYTGPSPQDRSGRSHDAAAGMSGGTPFRKAAEDIDDASRALGGMSDVAAPSARSLMGVGMGAGVATLGIAALTGAVAGVGLAGVAEDFAHSSQMMHAGGEAVRGFNKEFTAMQGATNAAGAAPMAGVAASMKGVGHELAAIGAANIGPVLNDVSSLGNQATAAMQKLAPSIGPAVQGLTALGGAVLGAFGDSGPAVTSFANTVTQNAAGLQSLVSGAISTAGAIGNATVATAANLPQGMDNVGSSAATMADKAAQWVGDQGRSIFGGKSVSPLSAMPSGHDMMGNPTTPAAPGAAAPVAPGAFDPSKPFSGQLPDGKGGFTTGTGDGGAAKPSKASGGGYQPSPDAARFSGMSAGDIMTQQRADVGMPPVGQPHYSGVGPRGPGQSVGAMPSSISAGLGGGGLAPLDNMMSAAQSHIASGGGGGGGGMAAAAVKHVQKATDVASGAASAGGASVGAAMGSGMAAGTSSSMTVTDTIIRKHIKHIIDLASAGLGIASPSKEFDYLGRMTGQGFGQGIERSADHTFGAMDGMLTGAQDQARKTSLDYDGGNDGAGVTVTAPRKPDPNQDPNYRANAMQYSPTAMANIQAHNDRAARLAQGRADNHAIAMANLGITNPETGQKWVDPRRINSNPLTGTSADPMAKAGGNNPLSGVKGLSDRFQQGGGLKGALGLEGKDPAQQSGALPRVGAGSSGAVLSQLNASKLGIAGAEHGLAMAQGVTVGLAKGTPGTQAGVAQFSKAVQGQHKKSHGIASPSTVFAGDGMNMAAGVGVGFAAGTPGVAASMSSAAGTMSDVVGGYLSDRGLMAGYAWAQNMVTGVNTEIKKADYQAMGIPKLAAEATRGLAATGLLTAGSGAQSYKTPGNGPGMVTLAPASSSSGGDQTITINHNIVHDDGHISQVATVVTLDMFGKLKDAQATRPR